MERVGGWKGFVDGEWRSGWWKEATWSVVVVEVKESGFEMCARYSLGLDVVRACSSMGAERVLGG